MTLPRNFPGRKNARRSRALARLERQIASGVKANSGFETPLTAGEFSSLAAQANTLALRITTDERARAIQTKKTKARGWSVARTAYRSGRL